jgi:FkbH-like protein
MVTATRGGEISPAKTAIIEKRLRGGLERTLKSIPPRPTDQPTPLSFAQQQLWLMHELQPEGCAYNVPIALRLNGPLDAGVLRHCLNEIVRRHEILRTTFPSTDGNPVQVVSPAVNQPLPMVNLRGALPDRQQTEVQRILTEEAQQPFDLAQIPLARFKLLCLGEHEHVLSVVMHHIICDGWSIGLFLRELRLLYEAAASKRAWTLPAPPIQYGDFAYWQQQSLRGERLEKQLTYWKEHLAGCRSSIALPVDGNLSPQQSEIEQGSNTRRGGKDSILFPKPFQDELAGLCHAHGLTPFMAFFGALVITLHRWTAQSDLVIGTVVAGRTRSEVENLIGCFINFLPLRASVSPENSALEILDRVKTAALEASSRQDCPFEKIVEAVNPERRFDGSPLYNVAFLLQNWPTTEWSSKELKVELLPVDTQNALLDLRFLAEEREDGLSLACEYDRDLFESSTIQLLLDAYRVVLEALVRRPETLVSDFELPADLTAHAERVRREVPQETLAISATFTAEPIGDALRFWIRQLELPVRIEFASYNQVFQQLLDPASLLASNSSGLNVTLLRVEDWLARPSHPESQSTSGKPEQTTSCTADVQVELERKAGEFVAALRAALTRSATPHLVCICPGAPCSDTDMFQRVEERLLSELRELNGVYVLTPSEVSAVYSVKDYLDADSDEIGHIPYTPQFFTALATMIARKFHVFKRPPKKVVVLDCDQTLWSGICGEDGPSGVCLNEARSGLQQFMREQYDSGMLLCLCSKNNEEDVWAVFDHHVDMPLRREHFVASRINWQPKSANLRSLAAELRLGLDSFIFVDDNPAECAEVEAACPQVLTLQLPEECESIPGFLRHVWAFDHLKLTREDRKRAQSYRQNLARERFMANAMSFADFLTGLQLQIKIDNPDLGQLPRVAELTQRTNQFNCTTCRRSEGEVHTLWHEKQMEFLAVSVTDRFGDYGLVGVLIFDSTEPRESTVPRVLEVDTFLLSCRVLGKGVEHQMLARLGQIAQSRGLQRVDVGFRSSAKNQPALDFLESVGASFRTPTDDGSSVFRFPAEYAANVTFAPQQSPASTVNSVEVPAARNNNGTESQLMAQASGRFPQCRWIAQNAQDPAEILKLVERSAPTAIRIDDVASRPAYVGPQTETERRLCSLWQDLLRLQRIGIHDDFFQLGGTSLLAVRFFAQLRKITGTNLPLLTLFKAPTVAQLAEILEAGQLTKPSPSLVALQSNGSRPALVLVHGAGGGKLWGYANLATKLGTDQPLYAFQPQGADKPLSIEEMARTYIDELRLMQPRGPYYLGGYCFGGYVAYEMARQLHLAGEGVGLVALIDAAAPNGLYERMPWWRPTFAGRFVRNVYYWLGDFCKLETRERLRFFRRKAAVGLRKIQRCLRRARNGDTELDLEKFIDTAPFSNEELALWQLHLQAGAAYVPQKYPGGVTLLRTRGQPLFCSLDPRYGWGELADAVDVKILTGSHEQIFVEPDLSYLSRTMRECLDEAFSRASRTMNVLLMLVILFVVPNASLSRTAARKAPSIGQRHARAQTTLSHSVRH